MSIFRSCGFRYALAVTLISLSAAPQAAPAFPALEVPALQVKAPERQVMLSAAEAGARVVAVGERGVVVLSDDGAKTWRQARRVPVSTTLTTVYFVDARMGWAVGHGGVILHTQDGGETWLRQTDGVALATVALTAAQDALRRQPDSPKAARDLKAARQLVDDGADKPLLDVYFADSRHGWVVGAYNLFFETRDGGTTWESAADRLENPKGLHLYAIRARGPTIFIVGEQGQMHRSADGGATFEALSSPYKGTWFTLCMTASGEVVTAGLRGNAFYSADSGKNWQRIEGSPPVSFVGAVALADGGVLLGNQGGQLFVSRSGAAMTPLSAPSLPPVAGMRVLKDEDIVLLGLGGAVRVTGASIKGGTSK